MRRIIDRRPFIVVPDGGLTIYTYGYAENLAHTLLLAVDQPDASMGQVFNAADATAFTLAQTIEIIAAALGIRSSGVDALQLAPVSRPMIRQLRTSTASVAASTSSCTASATTTSCPRPRRSRTARWLVDNPPSAEVEGDSRIRSTTRPKTSW